MTLEVMYLTWGETPRSYGIYRSQIAEMLREIRDASPDINLTLAAGLPVIHSGLVREKWNYPAELRTLRGVLGDIDLKICPIPVPQTFVFPTRRNFRVLFTAAGWTLLPLLRRRKPDVVHCRSLQAAWLAAHLRQKHGLGYRILYDARSLWPEMQYRRSPDAADLEFFKAQEAWLVAQVDAVMSVNMPMDDHYRALGARGSYVNYLAAPVPDPTPGDAAAPPPPLKLLYVGALYPGGMQNPAMLFNLFARVRELVPGSTLTVVTTSPRPPLNALAEEAVGADGMGAIAFTSAKSPAEVMAIATGHHLACNVYKQPTTDIDRLLCATGFSTKSAEYLAAGLPMLVSRYPEAICALVTEHGLGAVFDETVPDFGLDAETLMQLCNPDLAARAQEVARDLFDLHRVAERFADIYRDLASAPVKAGETAPC